jgi:hypothetical protein
VKRLPGLVHQTAWVKPLEVSLPYGRVASWSGEVKVIDKGDHEAETAAIRAWWRAWNLGAPLREIWSAAKMATGTTAFGQTEVDARAPSGADAALVWLDFEARLRIVPRLLTQSTMRVTAELVTSGGALPRLQFAPGLTPFNNAAPLVAQTLVLLDVPAESLPAGWPPCLEEARRRVQARHGCPQLFAKDVPPGSYELCDARSADGVRQVLLKGASQVFLRPHDIHIGPIATGQAFETVEAEPISNVEAVRWTSSEARVTWDGFLRFLTSRTVPRLNLEAKEAYLAERAYDSRAVVPVEKVDLEPGGRHRAVYRVLDGGEHPLWGRLRWPSASGYFDGLQQTATNRSFLDSSSDPGHSGPENEVFVEGTHPDDSSCLILSGRSQWPATGFIKPDPVGTGALRLRKQNILRDTLHLRSTTRSLTIANGEPGDPLWSRLSIDGRLRLVQGPPGTGKTWTACQDILGLFAAVPGARVLLLAKEHQALDNVLDSLADHATKAQRELRMLRIGGDLGRWHQPPWLQQLVAAARQDQPPDSVFFQAGVDFRLGMAEADVLAMTANDASIAELLSSGETQGFDFVVVEEAGKMSLSDMLPALALAPVKLLIGDTMQLPPFGFEELKRLLDTIRTESQRREARDTDERLLQEIRRLRLFIPDPPSKHSVLQAFRHLGEIHGMHAQLREQRRMRPELGNIIGQTFYGGAFVDKSAPNGERQPLEWQATPHASKDRTWQEASDARGSTYNRKEADLAVRLVREITKGLAADTEVVVLAPYSGQVRLIADRLADAGLKARVSTTDGFQGKEADVIILSLTRNNNQSTPTARWGFLVAPERVNVAFSRARQAMIVIGCATHIRETAWQPEQNALHRVLDAFAEAGAVKEVNP